MAATRPIERSARGHKDLAADFLVAQRNDGYLVDPAGVRGSRRGRATQGTRVRARGGARSAALRGGVFNPRSKAADAKFVG